MSTLTYRGIEYNIVLVDPTIGEAGDGTTPATALKDLPNTLINNTAYIFRRTDTEEVYVKHQTDNTIENIMFLGMPKATDEQWIQNLITDEEINNAWKADTYPYANIRFWFRADSTGYSDKANACIDSKILKYVTCINCYLYRGNPSSWESNWRYGVTCSPFFGNNFISTYKTHFLFYYCKFGVKGLNLDNDDWINTNTSVTALDGNNGIFSWYAKNYIATNYAKELILDNCIVNHIATSGYTNYTSDISGSDLWKWYSVPTAFKFSGISVTQISNCTVNCSGTYAGENVNDPAGVTTFYLQASTVDVHDCIINQVASSYIFPSAFYLYGWQNSILNVNNINIYFKKMKNYSSSTDLSNPIAGVRISGSYALGSIVNNIYLHGNETTGAKVCNVGALAYQSPRSYSQGAPFSHKVSNITVEESDNPSECVWTNTSSYPSAVMLDFDCGMNGDGDPDSYIYSSSNNYNYSNRYSIEDNPQIENISINAPYTFLYCTGVVANFGELRCGLKASIMNAIDIKKLTFDKSSIAGIQILGRGNYVRIREYVADPAIQNDTLQLSANYYKNSVYVDKSNVVLFNPAVQNYNSIRYAYSSACCLNMVQPGRFFARNGQVFAQSWGVVREGSTSKASLKLNCNTTGDHMPLTIGIEPYKGFGITPTKTGKQNLICYFAHKNFEESVKTDWSAGENNFILKIKVPVVDSKGDISYHYYSSIQGRWLPDTSTWNDSDIVPMKMVIPLDIKTTKAPLDIKIQYNWNHSSGFVYMDPEFHLEDFS